MCRRKSPVFETLENRSLLSTLSYSLTSDQSVYQVGQPIVMTFIEVNTGHRPIKVEVSSSDFTISQNNAVIWQSHPSHRSQRPTFEILRPGKSVSQTVSWDGKSNYSPYSVAGLLPAWTINDFGTFVATIPNVPHSLNATFEINDPIAYALTTDHPVYALGEPIQMTFTETNSSDQPVTVGPVQPAGFTITHNGTPVLIDVLPEIVVTTPTTIPAGQTIVDTQTWNGMPISGPDTLANLTGTFVVEYGPEGDPNQFTTTFQIVPPSS